MRPTLPLALGAAALAAAALLAPAASRADDKNPTPDDARARIRALELDKASDAIGKLKAAARTAADRAAIKDLDRELNWAQKIEMVAHTRIPQLVKQNKPRDAWALALQTADQFPNALALGELMKAANAPKQQAFFVVDDFDRSGVPPTPTEGAKFGQPPADVAGLGVSCSTVQLVDDGAGGRALRWTWSGLGAGEFACIGWTLRQKVSLASYEYATFRARVAKTPGKPLIVRFVAEKESDRGVFDVAIPLTATWKEFRVPLASLQKKGAWDGSHPVTQFGFACFGAGPAQVDLDEILLAKRPGS